MNISTEDCNKVVLVYNQGKYSLKYLYKDIMDDCRWVLILDEQSKGRYCDRDVIKMTFNDMDEALCNCSEYFL